MSVLESVQPRTVIAGIVLLFLLSVLAMIFSGNVGFYRVPTSSMEPTLIPGDRLISFAQDTYPRGTIVVLHDQNTAGDFLVKRVVAVSGDSVTIGQGKLFINGKQIDEPYIREPISYRFGPLILPKGQVFLLGDNRNESEDGHIWKKGISRREIVGAARYIYAPGDRRGPLEDSTNIFSNTQ